MMTEIRNFIEICGEMVILFFETVKASFILKNRYGLIFKNIITMGIRTLPIAMIMSFFVGMVLSLQSGYQLNKFGLNDILGAIVFLSLLKELAPVQTAVLMLAKVGTSITAEIGSMRVSEEIETLNIMGINIINYLIMPRFIACIFSTIILVIYADIIGLIGGAIVANYYFGLSYSKFFDS
ncbi:MAG TPA: ABC transporter permease, partial [bacterium]|nr:ABC transporter permease [bacterium]